MKETKKIKYGLDVKLNNSATLYHTIQGFINIKQVKYEPNNTFKATFW